jgi:hypothetical protein
MLVMIAGQLMVGPVGADDGPFRCGSKIIYNGMTQAEVFRYCGEPTSKSTEHRDVRSDKNRVLSTAEIDRWTYESYGATRVLVFLDYKLQSIQRL